MEIRDKREHFGLYPEKGDEKKRKRQESFDYVSVVVDCNLVGALVNHSALMCVVCDFDRLARSTLQLYSNSIIQPKSTAYILRYM